MCRDSSPCKGTCALSRAREAAAVQVAIKAVASGTEAAAAAKEQLMDLEQKLEAASQREASLKADISKVHTALMGPGVA